jgi:hypothetical protein
MLALAFLRQKNNLEGRALWRHIAHHHRCEELQKISYVPFDLREILAILLSTHDDPFAVHANCNDLVGISNTN